jgi:hypothetical protein
MLHKQNFDLKLEVYHRREKQSELEEQVKVLKADKAEMEEVNDQLMAELEKRDKAIQEAVNMIVVLEAQKDQLLKEREIVRRIEADGYSLDRPQTPRFAEPGRLTPKPFPADLPRAGDAKVINRMPSFMTELSDNTENLRDVYRVGPASLLGLPTISDDSPMAGRDSSKGITSPSLSVLSESSFLSVYGRRKDYSPSEDNNPTPAGDGTDENDETIKIMREHLFASTTPKTMPAQLAQRQGSNNSITIHTINEALDGRSPLQRLEKLERSLTMMNDDSRPSSGGLDRAASIRQGKLPAYSKTKQEKREALQKVLTSSMPGRDFEHAALPPTPDTISTSTLRHYKKSNDTLPKETDMVHDRSYLALSETTSASDIPPFAQPASTSAFDSRKGLAGSNGYFDPTFGLSPPTRPRSAGATTLSHRRQLSDWESDDSFDNADDDIWLQQGVDAGQANALDPSMSVSQAGGRKKQPRGSPDLFLFPSTAKGWATDTMFGQLSGGGLIGARGNMGAPMPLAQTLDALGDSLPTPLFGSGLASPALAGVAAPPPPPNRRSSLQATTGAGGVIIGSGTVGTSPARPGPANGKLRKSPVRSNRTRSNSIDAQPPPTQQEIGFRQDRASTMPPRENQFGRPPPTPKESIAPQQTQPLPKQRHYPPTASQPPRSRGLNLFRRSTGSAEPPKFEAPASAPATETTFKNAPQTLVGIPSWGRRNTLTEDDRFSATPPPIMRNPNTRWASNEDGGGAPLDTHEAGGAPVGVIPGTAPIANGQRKAPGTSGSGGAPVGAELGSSAPNPTANSGGTRRKWLGLGRVGSLRNHRAG